MKKLIKLSLLSLFFLILPITAGAQGDPSHQAQYQEYDPNATVVASSTTQNNISGNALLNRLKDVGGKAGYTTDEAIASTPRIVGIIVGAFINFTGLTFIVLMIIAGYGWMTSNGNEEKIKKSVSTIKASIIGLVVSLSAWAIWNLIFEKLILG